MPFQPLKLRPGIDTQLTATANELGWSASQMIRWVEGLPEKRGGWARLNDVPLPGCARGIHAWADLSGNAYLAMGSDQRLQVFALGLMNDITPLRKSTTPAVAFSTSIGSNIVTIADAGHGATDGDWLHVVVPVAVGGLVIHGFYQMTVVGGGSYTIVASGTATGNVAGGGAVPAFSAAASPNLLVTLAGHGLAVNDPFTVEVATSVGGTLVPSGPYTVVAPVAADTFVIQPGPVYNGSASENGGLALLQYLVPNGLASDTALSGFGIGPFGGGGFGVTTATRITPLRQWFLDNWGADFIGNYNGSPIFVWSPPVAAPALAIDTVNFPGATEPPTAVNISFISVAQQMVVALGSDPFGGSLDPNLVRWSDAGDRTAWRASALNQAGSFRIPSGSALVAGHAVGKVNLLFTDIDVWSMTYQGLPFVWAFTKLADAVALLSSRAVDVLDGIVYWAAESAFQLFNGTVQTIPCPVWDAFFKKLDRSQLNKVNCAVNSYFGEVSWFFQSLGGTDVDSYVTFHVREGVWSYGSLDRTAWCDTNVLGAPIGVDCAGILFQHETGYDADGLPLPASIESGWMTLQEGTWMTFLERVLPEFKLSGGTVFWEIDTAEFPVDAPETFGPYAFDGTAPQYEVVRARGRLFRFRIFSTGAGVWWRLGGLRWLGAPAGRQG